MTVIDPIAKGRIDAEIQSRREMEETFLRMLARLGEQIQELERRVAALEPRPPGAMPG